MKQPILFFLAVLMLIGMVACTAPAAETPTASGDTVQETVAAKPQESKTSAPATKAVTAEPTENPTAEPTATPEPTPVPFMLGVAQYDVATGKASVYMNAYLGFGIDLEDLSFRDETDALTLARHANSTEADVNAAVESGRPFTELSATRTLEEKYLRFNLRDHIDLAIIDEAGFLSAEEYRDMYYDSFQSYGISENSTSYYMVSKQTMNICGKEWMSMDFYTTAPEDYPEANGYYRYLFYSDSYYVSLVHLSHTFTPGQDPAVAAAAIDAIMSAFYPIDEESFKAFKESLSAPEPTPTSEPLPQITETVVVDDSGFTVTATGLTEDKTYCILQLHTVNQSKKTVGNMQLAFLQINGFVFAYESSYVQLSGNADLRTKDGGFARSQGIEADSEKDFVVRIKKDTMDRFGIGAITDINLQLSYQFGEAPYLSSRDTTSPLAVILTDRSDYVQSYDFGGRVLYDDQGILIECVGLTENKQNLILHMINTDPSRIAVITGIINASDYSSSYVVNGKTVTVEYRQNATNRMAAGEHYVTLLFPQYYSDSPDAGEPITEVTLTFNVFFVKDNQRANYKKPDIVTEPVTITFN